MSPLTEDEAITLLLGRVSSYAWDVGLVPRSCGAVMRDQANHEPWFTDAELYGIAISDLNQTTRALAAKLYVAEKRLATAQYQLSEKRKSAE